MVEGKSLKCPRCEHEWSYTGKKLEMQVIFPLYVSCPLCRTSVRLNDIQVKKDG